MAVVLIGFNKTTAIISNKNLSDIPIYKVPAHIYAPFLHLSAE